MNSTFGPYNRSRSRVGAIAPRSTTLWSTTLRSTTLRSTPRPSALLWSTLLLCLAACAGEDETVEPGATPDTGVADTGEDVASDTTAGDGGGGTTDGSATQDGSVEIVGPGKPCVAPLDCGDDPDPCTRWVCHSELGCVVALAPDDALCSLDDACFPTASCQGGVCKAKSAKDCDDGDLCTIDDCEGGACVHLPHATTPANDVPCDDGLSCTKNDTCKGGACKGGTNVCACSTDADCPPAEVGNACAGAQYCALQADGARACVLNPATVVICDPSANTPCLLNACDKTTGKCGLSTLADGTACNDGDKCTGGETCQGAKCAGGKPICCQVDADCLVTDDGDFCNGVPYCNKATGTCLPNPASVVYCPTVDDTACSQNLCAPKTGLCGQKASPNKGFCDDGNPCTPGQEACEDGVCKAATNTCACTKDADCQGKDDGDLCNGTLYCVPSTGTCQANPATIVLCPNVDDTACSKNTCAAKTGVCAQKPVADGSECDADGSPCTPVDTCDQGVCKVDDANTCKCTSTEACAKFDDGDLCNGNLYCDLKTSTCQLNAATVVSCPSADNTACLQSLCQAKTGKCAATFVNQGKICEDGVPCTSGDLCENGACKAGSDICLCHKDADCAGKEDGNVCNGTLYCDTAALPWSCQVKPSTVITCPNVNDSDCQKSICQTKTGKCEILLTNLDGPCDDGDPCTEATVCKGNDCINPLINQAKACDDGNPCTDDSCDKAIGCLNLVNKAPCDDGDACTVGEACSGKVCLTGKAKTCDDGNVCTTDYCVAKQGCLVFENSATCSDGNACTLGDGCKAGACAAGSPKVCVDTNPCSLDSCNMKSGACEFDAKVPAAVACNDNVACTIDSCDQVLGCQQVATDGLCTDNQPCTQDTCSKTLGCQFTTNDAKCDDKSACTLDTCVAKAGCQHVAVGDGASCFDDDPCTVGDICTGGKCIAGAKSALCNIDPSQCQGKADGGGCNDGDACTKGETCVGGVCRGAIVGAAVSPFVGTFKAPAGKANGHRLRAQLETPAAVARSLDGSIVFITETGGQIRRIALDSQVTTVAGDGANTSKNGHGLGASFANANGLAVADDGAMYVADALWLVRKVATDGVVSHVAGTSFGYKDGPGAQAQFRVTAGLAAQGGTLFVADKDNHCIRAIDLKSLEVSSFAGSCTNLGSTDGAKGVAKLSGPQAVAVHPAGGLVVADTGNHRLRRVAADGTITTLAGSGSGFADGKGTAAKFNQPRGLAVAISGEIYVTDMLNHRLRLILPSGEVTTLAGSTAGYQEGNGAAARFSSPTDVALDALGDLVVVDTGNLLLRRVALRRHSCDDGNHCTQDRCDASSGACLKATPVCDDNQDCSEDACSESTGACSFVAVADGSSCGDGDPCTTTHFCNGGECFAAGKVVLEGADTNGKRDGGPQIHRIQAASGMALLQDGSVVFGDGPNQLVRKRSPDGVVTTIAGSPWFGAGYKDGLAFEARFNDPSAVLPAADGSLWISDRLNNRIRRLSADGVVSTLAGQGAIGSNDGEAGVARFHSPEDMIADGQGGAIVADRMNSRLRIVQPSGAVSTLVGSQAGWRDGPLVDARLNQPRALARAPNGAVYVADWGQAYVRRIADGMVVTVAGRGTNANAGGIPLGSAVNQPIALDVDAEGGVWIGDGNGVLSVLHGDRLTLVAGRKLGTFTAGLGPNATLSALSGLVVLPDGSLLIGSSGSARIARVARPILACDDGKPCTIDRCVAFQGCVHLFAASACDDGDPCTVGDVCQAGACNAGPAALECACKAVGGGTKTCDDGNACTDDGCDAKVGCTATKRPDGAACDDGSPCSGQSTCTGAKCHADALNYTVRRFAGARDGITEGGIQDGVLLPLGGAVASAQLSYPRGMATLPDGSVVFCDNNSHSLRIIKAEGFVTTLAGARIGTVAGYVDGDRQAARFNGPQDVEVLPSGDLVVADQLNHAIRLISVDGAVTTLAGAKPTPTPNFADGKGSDARFNNPRGVSVLGDGSIVVADSANYRLRRVGLDGEVTTLAGSTVGTADGPAAQALLNAPCGVDVGPGGAVYFVSEGDHTLRRLQDGTVTTLTGGGGIGFLDGHGLLGGGLDKPQDVEVGSGGEVFITDQGNWRVRRWTQSDGLQSIAGTSFVSNAKSKGGPGASAIMLGTAGLAMLPDGSLLAGEGSNHRIVRLRRVDLSCDDGNDCTLDVCDPQVGCKNTAAKAELVCPDGGPCQQPSCDVAKGGCSYAARPDGTLCGKAGLCGTQCDQGTCRAGGLITPLAGKGDLLVANGPAATASFYGPSGLVSDGKGGLYISDQSAHTLRHLSAEGIVSTVAGASTAGYVEGDSTTARFKAPVGLDRDPLGNIVVADRDNHRIRRVSPQGNTTLIAGSGSLGHADGPAFSAKFSAPRDIAVEASGAIFVADTANHVIRKIAVDGQVTTVAGSPGLHGVVDGKAPSARLHGPGAIAIGKGGVLWIGEASGTIRRMLPDGTLDFALGRGFQTSGSHFDGLGLQGPGMNDITGLALLPDGDLVVTTTHGVIRRAKPYQSAHTLVGKPGNSTLVFGFGHEARLNQPLGIALMDDGTLAVGDYASRRVVRLRLDAQTCEQLAGASPSTAGLSCAAIAKTKGYQGLPFAWVDVDGAGENPKRQTACDDQTAGGGWTAVTTAFTAPEVKALLGTGADGAKGQVMLRCSVDGPESLVSPAADKPFSWSGKSAVPGTWQVNGKPVSCGADESFAATPCGTGWGCSDGSGANANRVLHGMSAPAACAAAEIVHTSGAMTICPPNHKTWLTYVRKAP